MFNSYVSFSEGTYGKNMEKWDALWQSNMATENGCLDALPIEIWRYFQRAVLQYQRVT